MQMWLCNVKIPHHLKRNAYFPKLMVLGARQGELTWLKQEGNPMKQGWRYKRGRVEVEEEN